jgi:hypothetical protein
MDQRPSCKSQKKLMTICYLIPQETRNEKSCAPSSLLSHLIHIQMHSSFRSRISPQSLPYHHHHASSIIISPLIPNHASSACSRVTSLPQYHQLHPRPGQIPHQHSPCCKESREGSQTSRVTVEKKTSENEGLFAPEPLPQENPHHLILFPIHHADIWRI